MRVENVPLHPNLALPYMFSSILFQISILHVFLYSAAETSLLLKIIRKGLVESNLDLEVQRKDPKSPLHSVKTFEALHL